MVSHINDLCNQFPANLYDYHNYPNWLEVNRVIIYSRTSPNQSGEQRKGEYQPAYIENFAREHGLIVAGTYSDIGKTGHRIGEKTTPQLIAAIEHAKRTGFPIVAFDWQRFSREPHKLARYPVHFVSLVSLAVDPAIINGIRKRAANQINPEGKGGRNPNLQANYQLPFILSKIGKWSWLKIARELAEKTESKWSDNKVKRTLLNNFVYVDSTKLPIQGSSPTVAE